MIKRKGMFYIVTDRNDVGYKSLCVGKPDRDEVLGVWKNSEYISIPKSVLPEEIQSQKWTDEPIEAECVFKTT